MSAIDQRITLAVLAGGRARRMDGEDKGLITVAGKPMVSHVLDRFADDAAQVQIIANRNQDRYRQLGYPVHADDLEGFQGPMAGMRTALAHCTTPYLMVLPCDVPMAPRDLVHKLLEQLQATDAEIAVACDDEREHSVILLMKANLTDSIDAFLANGDRKILLWYNQHRVTKVTFAGQAQAFANINTAEQRDQLEQLLLADKDS
ncbi:molybdenum cofactor guanylyltransferase MobA [Ferrimonas sp. SCSIO 43195]|uniref:molybdenum cofactor guanylyltransferase MobA n=1 Tax=Ferrimonas sp. SCSIO 43195 TaxID=2822844 RepID=UPI002075B02E|nr:molybdenum cofactor guanylyltransferase MobA [Ferrimonas sp. SCSIO 43195]